MPGRPVTSSVYYGWVVVFACFLTNGVVFGLTYTFGVFLEPLGAAFEASTAETSLVFGAQLFVLYITSPPVGGFVEWIGPRRGLVVAAACLGAGMLGASRAGSLPVLMLTYSLVTGLGMSIAFVVGYATPPQWFRRSRGLATGIASAGLGVGLIVVAPAASFLVADLGWRGAYVALGVGLMALLTVAAFLMADDPEDVDADAADEFPDGRPTTSGTWRQQLVAVGDVARSPAFRLLFVGFVLLYGTLYVLLNHIVNFAGELGVRAAGVLAVSVVGVTTTVTRLAVGGVADRIGRLAMFVLCGGVMGVALLVLPMATGSITLLLVAGLFGVGYGGTGALMSSVPADLFGGANLNAIFGLTSLSLAVPGLVAPAAAGYGFDQLGTYTPVFLATGVVGLVGAALVGGAAALEGELTLPFLRRS